jgi:hypothetical protein
MGMACTRQILGGAAELHQHAGLVNHFTGLATNDVNPKDTIGLGIR